MKHMLRSHPNALEEPHRYQMCSRKKWFDSKHNAEHSKGGYMNNQRAYDCPYCGGWHLTKKEGAK